MVSKTALLAIAPFIAAASACSGDFAATCTNIALQKEGANYFLNALCGNGQGGHNQASYNLGSCIGNDDGKLVCGGGDRFQDSCGSVSLQGTVLHANCKDDGENGIPASINLDNIIGNFGGNIHC